MRDSTARRLSRVHSLLYRVTDGRVGRRLVDNDMLLLTTTGRRSRKPHTVPLLYLRDAERMVVFASWGGRDRHPEWYLNLLDHPEATVQVDDVTLEVEPRTATGDERDRLWSRAVAAYSGYETYQSRTDREIPVVVLRPVGGEA